MKKRAMKKWIPKGFYCYDKNGMCKWRKWIGIKRHTKEECDNMFGEGECASVNCEECDTSIFKCEYLGLIDEEADTLLWDACKECGEKEYGQRK